MRSVYDFIGWAEREVWLLLSFALLLFEPRLWESAAWSARSSSGGGSELSGVFSRGRVDIVGVLSLGD